MEMSDNLQDVLELGNDLLHGEIDIAEAAEGIPKVFELASNFFDSDGDSPLSFENIKLLLFDYLDQNDSQTLESEEIAQAAQQLIETFNLVSQTSVQMLKSEEVKQLKQQLQQLKQQLALSQSSISKAK